MARPWLPPENQNSQDLAAHLCVLGWPVDGFTFVVGQFPCRPVIGTCNRGAEGPARHCRLFATTLCLRSRVPSGV